MTLPSVEFWNELGVDYDDLSRGAAVSKDQAVTKLFHRLREKEDQWRIVLRNVLNSPHDDIRMSLHVIYIQRRTDFVDILATLALANKVGERTRMIETFKRICANLQELFRAFPGLDLAVMIFCVYRINPEEIRNWYYEFNIESKDGKKFRSEKRIEQGGTITHEDIQRLMEEWQSSRGRKDTLHLWWSKCESGTLKMAFRKQRKGTTSLPLLYNNEFVRTASQSYFVFYDGLNELEIISNRVAKGQRQLAEFIAGKISRTSVAYEEVSDERTITEFRAFLNQLTGGQMDDVVLVEVHRRNAPLSGSPMLSLLSEGGESIAGALNDLESKRVPILDSPQDIVKIGVKISNVKFFIKLGTNSKGNVEFVVDRRYHSSNQMSLLKRLFKRP